MMSSNHIEEIANVLKTKTSFLLTTSSPDGDAVGSMLALAHGILNQKKQVEIFSPEPIPENLNFLSNAKLITTKIPARAFDAMIVMDTGSSKLLFDGNRDTWSKLSPLVIDLDHHPDNDRFGTLNWVDPKSASTGEIVFLLLRKLGWEIDGTMAECLLTAVMADTGAFRYPNVTPTTLQIAAVLLEKGAQNGKIARSLYSSATPTYLKLLGKMLVNLHFELDGKLAWSVLSQEDFKNAQADDDTADKMVEQLDMLRDVQVAALFRQMSAGKIKVSLRSRSNLPVNKVAALFGGGGHVQAAGCQLEGDLQEAETKVVNELRLLFDEEKMSKR